MKKILSLIYPVIVGVVLYGIIFMLFHPFVVTGQSMYPTFKDQDIVICHASFDEKDLKRGDIVIVRQERKKIIKRLIALPGDTAVIKDGYLYVNGERSVYNFDAIIEPGMLSEEITLDDSTYLYLGDNRNESYDSRKNGGCTINDICYLVKKKIF